MCVQWRQRMWLSLVGECWVASWASSRKLAASFLADSLLLGRFWPLRSLLLSRLSLPPTAFPLAHWAAHALSLSFLLLLFPWRFLAFSALSLLSLPLFSLDVSGLALFCALLCSGLSPGYDKRAEFVTNVCMRSPVSSPRGSQALQRSPGVLRTWVGAGGGPKTKPVAVTPTKVARHIVKSTSQPRFSEERHVAARPKGLGASPLSACSASPNLCQAGAIAAPVFKSACQLSKRLILHQMPLEYARQM